MGRARGPTVGTGAGGRALEGRCRGLAGGWGQRQAPSRSGEGGRDSTQAAMQGPWPTAPAWLAQVRVVAWEWGVR